MVDAATTTTTTTDGALAAAMAQVQALHQRATQIELDSVEGVDVVHELRVALRRCRSLAQGLAAVDVSERKLWRRLARLARPLFAGLGAVRDAQVMRGWVVALVPQPAQASIVAVLDAEIASRADDAAAAVGAFDVGGFVALLALAPARAALMRRRRPLLLYLALTRLAEGRALHLEAMRRRGAEQLHDTRIGVKRLRYTLDSLLPDLHDVVAKPLKKMQAALGDLHDFDVLLDRIDALFSEGVVDNTGWTQARAPIDEARAARLTTYKQLATGRTSAWISVKRALPIDPTVITRCRRAYLLEVAASLGVDHRRARKAEQAVTMLASLDGRTVGSDERFAAVLAAAHHRRSRAATRELLGFSLEHQRRLRRLMARDRAVQAAGLAASE